MLTLIVNEDSADFDGLIADFISGGIGKLRAFAKGDEQVPITVRTASKVNGVWKDTWQSGDVIQIGIGTSFVAPVCLATLSDTLPAAGVTASVEQAASGSLNNIWRISFTDGTYGGLYSISATVNSVTASCGSISPLASVSQIVVALTNHPQITTHNVSVTKDGADILIEFIGNLSSQSETVSVTNVSLLAPVGNSGTLDINTTGMLALFEATALNQLTLELGITRTRGANVSVVYQSTVIIYRSVVDPSTAVPTPSIGLPVLYDRAQSLTSGEKAQARSNIGAMSQTDTVNIPSDAVAHFTSTGGASGADGTLTKPFGTNQLQTAFDAGFRAFEIGDIVSVGNLTIPDSTTETLSFLSNNATNTLGNLIGHGCNLTVYSSSPTANFVSIDVSASQEGMSGGNVIAYGVNSTSCNTSGADGSQGTPAGNVTINGGYITTITANGGASTDGVTNGANGGNVSLNGLTGVIPSISQSGGAGNGAPDGSSGNTYSNNTLNTGHAISLTDNFSSGGIANYTFGSNAYYSNLILTRNSPLGTPNSGNLSSCTNFPVGGLSGLGIGVSNALNQNIGSSGAFVVYGGALGTPTSGTLTNCTFPTLNQNTTGSAATWTTGRTLSITGDLSYTSPSFNGSANVTAAGTLATVNSNVGSFGSATASATLTVNAKGLVTGVTNTAITPAISNVSGINSMVKTALANTPNTTGGLLTYDAATLSGLNFVSISSSNLSTFSGVFSTAQTITIPDVTGTLITTGNLTSITSLGTITGQIINTRAGTANSPSVKISGGPYSSGNGTTAHPLFYIADSTATASATLTSAGTYFGINGHGTSPALMSLMVDGINRLLVDGKGQFSTSNSTGSGSIAITSNTTSINAQYNFGNVDVQLQQKLILNNAQLVGFQASGVYSGSPDVTISRNAAGVLQIGTSSANASGSLAVTDVTASGKLVKTPQALTGAGAIDVVTSSTAWTSSGIAQALTLANGTNGQIKTISHVSRGSGTGTGILTPTTSNGFTTITFTNAGDSVSLQYFSTGGWCIIGSRGVTIA